MASAPQNDVDFTPHFSSRRHTQKLSSWNHETTLLVWHGTLLAIHKSMNELNRKIEAAKKAHLAALRALAMYEADFTVIVQAKGKAGYFAARKAAAKRHAELNRGAPWA